MGRANACSRAGDLEGAFRHYTVALDLWRGPVLADVDLLRDCPPLNLIAGQRLAAITEYADVGLALGLYRAVLPQLAAACDRDPLNGAPGARLMLALAGAGQQVAALRFFEQTRDRLARDLGIDPDPELSHAFRIVLRQDVRGRQLATA